MIPLYQRGQTPLSYVPPSMMAKFGNWNTGSSTELTYRASGIHCKKRSKSIDLGAGVSAVTGSQCRGTEMVVIAKLPCSLAPR